MKTRYIFSSGEISRKDNSIAFKNKKGWNYIPVESVRELYFLNEVSLNSKFLDFCSRVGIVLHFFNYYGNYSGSYYPKESLISGNLAIKQSLFYVEKRLIVARNIVRAIGLNIYEVLYHYYRHGKDLKETLNNIKEQLKLLERNLELNQILSIEGALWQIFYSSFKYFLPNDFLMEKRVKRPPNNPINALISFGNSLLYTKTISAIYQTHLNPTISFLHSPSEARFSLSLDLSEAFKPIIVYKTIFEMINRKKIQLKHFEKKLNYAILNEEGRKIFIQNFENRLNEKFLHPKLKRKISYQSAIKFDGYKLIKAILEDIEFMPFLLRDKR